MSFDRHHEHADRIYRLAGGLLALREEAWLGRAQLGTVPDRIDGLQRELLRVAGDEIIGADLGLREVMRQVGQVAPTESPVLLTGETGTGKELLAEALHLASRRRKGPFIPINCAAIPKDLQESELFGHRKGAFTSASHDYLGRIRTAHGGTVFLDEVAELSKPMQVKLLRVLQSGEFQRLGSSRTRQVDVRVISASRI